MKKEEEVSKGVLNGKIPSPVVDLGEHQIVVWKVIRMKRLIRY